MVRKKDGAVCNQAVGVPEKDVVGKQDGSVMIGSRRWFQEFQPMT